MFDLVTTVNVAPIAGIGIGHEIDSGIALASPMTGSEWIDRESSAGALVIRHRVGDARVPISTRVFEVGPHASYHDIGSGKFAVSMMGLIPGVDRLLLETVEPGQEYEFRYSSAPEGEVPRNTCEIPAYALALATRRAGVLAHGCGVILPSGVGVVCLGVSGAGKSTLARMLQSTGRVRVLNDDRVVLANRGSGMRVWSTPWPGRAGVARLGDAPLSVLAIIGKGAVGRVRALVAREMTTMMLQTLAIPVWEPEQAGVVLDTVALLQSTVPIVRIEYPLAAETGDWLVDTLETLASQ